ncbi:hypothetical protein MMC30_002076 [Trapelia coarctata]|nr:hypothetical protein [Trapelia coarctata]
MASPSNPLSFKALKSLAALAALLLTSSVAATPLIGRDFELSSRDLFGADVLYYVPQFERRSELFLRTNGNSPPPPPSNPPTPPPPSPKPPGAPVPPDSQKMSAGQAAQLMRPPSPDKGALYTHTNQPKPESADMGRQGFKGAIESAGQTHIGTALNTQSHGKLDDPKNPNTFLSTDPDKSGRAKKKENDPKWDKVSGQFAHDLKGNVPLHTDGAGPVKPGSVAGRIELPAVQRPGGPATSIGRTDHKAGTTTQEWQRPQSRPGSPAQGPSNPPVRPPSPPPPPPRPASPPPPAPRPPPPQAPPTQGTSQQKGYMKPTVSSENKKKPKKQKRALYAAARAHGLGRRDVMALADMMAIH